MTDELNSQQREAVEFLGKALLVIAGAGSGKTRVIGYKIKHLVDIQYCQPSQIAAITFTNKSAREMRERLSKLVPLGTRTAPMISTFHTMGLQILRHEASFLGLKNQFSIFDSHDAIMTLQDITASTRQHHSSKIKNQISNWKNNNIFPDEAISLAKTEEELQAALTYERYQKALRGYQAVDFDDLITLPLQLFENYPERLQFWQNRIRYFLIDEYQDTNLAQYQLVKKLSYPKGDCTFVGDDDQAIYAWRGATRDNIKLLQQDYPQLKIVRLEQNYRSTNSVLKAANNLIQKNGTLFEKTLWSQLGEGKPITLTSHKTEELEAKQIVETVAQHQLSTNSNWSQYAILYRNNYQARLFENYLQQNGIPYNLSGGQSFFDRTEIKDILSYLRLMVNNDNDVSFIRAATKPRRGIGPTTLEKLSQYASERQISLFEAVFETGLTYHLNEKAIDTLKLFGNFINNLSFRSQSEPASLIVREIIKSIRYEEYLLEHLNERDAAKKWENVQNFCEFIERQQKKDDRNLSTITQNITLMNIISQKDSSKEKLLEMSTLHAAKGLEFDYVFIVGCNEGIIPHQECIDNNLLDEERRLMYVGITRARRELTISFTEKRRISGESVENTPSRFIEEMGLDTNKTSNTQIPSNEEKQQYLKRMRSSGSQKKKPILL
ncbi:ATP-dependent helicase [Candidatus Ichthyocystis hellenicum]|uniref:ATP-dependent helicase n=1 Tax=Candidatus Ichthyocystis hellenicum TaxID=1561003 RepID=UPI000AA65129|nr:UvrD-helicase domain-containing protein [Candidatus Ichthyocystis hellenicum]